MKMNEFPASNPGNKDSRHFRAQQPKAFNRANCAQATIIFGGLHWRVERLIQGAMANMGYRSLTLPSANRRDLSTGRELADIGQCCPTSFITGNLVNFLREQAQHSSKQQLANDYVYLTASSCGSCRFGQYHKSFELALNNIGLDSFRILTLGQGPLDQAQKNEAGPKLDAPFLLGVLWSILVSDIVQDMEYQVRPYEIHAGETDKVARASIEYLHQVFHARPLRGKQLGALLWHLATPYFTDALREVQQRFAQIEVDRLRVKPVVKITGEFYLQTVEGDANYNIHRWLEAEGAEVYPAAITVWFDYLMRLSCQKFSGSIGVKPNALLKLGGIHLAQQLLRWSYARMRKAMDLLPHELPNQAELRKLAAPYFHPRMDGGEGDMLIGKALWAHHHNKAHMICEVSPYACIPNTMSVGAMAEVIAHHPDLLYAPLEIKGDAEVHALSRCQMILTEARQRAQTEYEQALERSGFGEYQLREMLHTQPALKLATYRIPHHGVAGAAANLVLHLAASKRA